jgi:hypothetical protein
MPIMISPATLVTVAALSALQVHGLAVDLVGRATPTVYLAGDSTMAKMGTPIDGKADRPLQLSQLLDVL